MYISQYTHKVHIYSTTNSYMFWQRMGGIVLGMFTCVVLFNPPNIPLRCFITIPIFQASKRGSKSMFKSVQLVRSEPSRKQIPIFLKKYAAFLPPCLASA